MNSDRPAAAVIPIILSGGAGARLWPVSRQGHPKPFIKLPDGQSLLHKTLLRAGGVASVEQMLLVTNRDYYFISKDEVNGAFEGATGPTTDYLLEPVGRNTAAAVAAAAHWVVSRIGPDALMLILPADHLITPAEEFKRDVQAAVALAQQGKLVTFGIRPTRPETGYGYIECGERLAGTQAKVVRRFVEKPDLATARDYARSPDFLWNSGMFCMQAQIFLDELKRHRPGLSDDMAVTWAAVPATGEHSRLVELPAAEFEKVESISIDYAVMEHSDKLVVLPTEASWNDIGSWSSVAALSPADARGNRVRGEALLYDCATAMSTRTNESSRRWA